ncbi:MAG: alpha/beta fold hydrolase [Pseudonocardia sp.]
MSRRGRGSVVRIGAAAGATAVAAWAATRWATTRWSATRAPQRAAERAPERAAERPAPRRAAREHRGRPVLRLVEPPPRPHHRAGSGTPLVLLHGITGTWRMWEPLLPHLEPHHDVLALTLLGHRGGAPLADGAEASLDALVDAVATELDRLGIDRAHLAGNSLGGWVAIELARRGRARSLVLFSPAGAYRSRRRLAGVTRGIGLSLAVLNRLLPHVDRIVARPRLRRALLWSQVAHPERVPADVVASMLRASAGATIAAPLLRVLGCTPLPPLPIERDYPIRLVWAEPDRMIPFAHFGAPMLAKLPGAELIRQRGIGHVPMSDDPQLVARLITEVTTAADMPRASAGPAG